MNRLFFLLIIFLTACTAKYNTEETTAVIKQYEHCTSISMNDAKKILNQLDLMLCAVCEKAENIADKGTDIKNIRDSLKSDTSYIALANQAAILDSIFLNYMDTCHNYAVVKYEYDKVLKKYARRARRSGLN